MDFTILDDLNVDSDTERTLIELASVLNSLAANNPDVNLSSVVEKISDLLISMSALFETNKSLCVKNDELYCKNLELDSLVVSLKKSKQVELNESLHIHDCFVEKNEVLSNELKSANSKISNLKSQISKLNKEDSDLKSRIDVSGSVSVLDEVSQLRQKVTAYQENIHTLISKLDLAVKTNAELVGQLDGNYIQSPSPTSVNTSKWFDDSILQNYFSSFKKHPSTILSKALFIDPSVSEILKHGCTVEVNKQLNELKVESYNFVFCSVSNSKGSKSFSKRAIDHHDEGSHWSLLFCDMLNKVAYHLDSVRNLNVDFATVLANKFGCTLKSVACYQQNNGFECGLNVLVNAKLILYYFCSEVNIKCSFLKWFEKCTTGTLSKPCTKTTQLPKPKKEEMSNTSTPHHASVILVSKEKLSLRLKKVNPNTWQVVKPKNSRKYLTSSPTTFEPMTSNRFSSLTDLSPEVTSCENQSIPHSSKEEFLQNASSTPISCKRMNPNLIPAKKNHFRVTPSSPLPCSEPKISIYGDSQVRNLSNIVRSMAKKGNFEVSSMVKPNAKMGQILDGINKDKSMCSQDTIVIVGGTNNIATTGHCNSINTEVKSFLAEVKTPKILLVGVPTRHDKPSLSSTISKINKDLSSISKLHKNVVFIPLDLLSRDSFTKRGLHLNLKGKTSLANLILKAMNAQTVLPVTFRPLSKTPHPPSLNNHVQPEGSKRHPIPRHSITTSNRTFVSKDFLGEARKPPGVPWALFLKRDWGVHVRP